jgi:hypothetical protein
MRACFFFCLFVCVTLLADTQQIDTHISSVDLREIFKVVAAVTKDPIDSVKCLSADGPGPNTYPVQCFDAAHNMQAKTCYNRIDLVGVGTAGDKRSGLSFKVQKFQDGWKIIDRGYPITE